MATVERLRSRLMAVEDLDQVYGIEILSYPNPWPRSAFVNELEQNALAYYIVALLDHKIVGYGGQWMILDEAHITNIAVHPDQRRKGVGEWILVRLIDHALKNRMGWITLEVRPSNRAAQALYLKYGFKSMGTRKAYYSDNNEDAIIMWSPRIDEPEFPRLVEKNRAALESRVDLP